MSSSNQQYREVLTLNRLLRNFPKAKYPDVLSNQRAAFELIADTQKSVLLEMPTGSGKTAVGHTYLKTLANAGVEGPLFYLVPTKALVDQVKEMFPDVTAVYGRNEYDCLYYEPEETFKADEIPCLSLLDCAHRVDQETGQTLEPGATPCPYYGAKFGAKRSPIVVTTTAFYIYTQFFSKEFEPPAGLVIDEVHQFAESIRSALSYDITDWHLARCVELLRRHGAADEADQLQEFLTAMTRIVKRKSKRGTGDKLLKDEELLELVATLEEVEIGKIESLIKSGIKSGQIDAAKDRVVLKQLETITLSLPRYVRSLDYARDLGEERKPLNYVTYAAFTKPEDEEKRVKCQLTIEANYIVPLVRRLLSPRTLAMSATIGDPQVFGWDSGLTPERAKFASLPATFPPENTGVFLPTDTPNLATKYRSSHEPAKVLRKIAKSCHRLGEQGHRSLVALTSNYERERFLALCEEEKVEAVSYGNGTPAREAVSRFKSGEGTALVGTMAHFGQGIDLPDGMAPVAFVLRPGYPNPGDARAQFEKRRYGNRIWAIWGYRVMIEALQVRGRNVRSPDDRGVTIFISQQYVRFLYHSLPEWLKEAYRRDLTLAECEEVALELLE